MALQLSAQIFNYKDTTYYPRVADNNTVWRQAAYAVITPRNYDKTKTYPVWMLIHGQGELSEGKIANLRNIVQGFTQSDGSRLYAIATDDFKAAINTYQFIAVLPTYGSEFNPTDINFVLDEVEKSYSVDKSREALIGFSLGGGAVVRYMTSSLANAQRIALAVPCSPVNWATNYKNVTDADLPVVGATNRTDGRVDPSNVKTIIAGINALSPRTRATLITFDEDGHGSVNRMLALSDRLVPQTMYEYLQTIDKDNPRPYPTSTTVPPVQPPPPVTTLTAVAKEIGITTVAAVVLDGSASKNFQSATWGVISVPTGVNPYSNLFPKGSGYYTVNATLPKEGAYSFVLNTYAGTQTARDTIVVTYQKTSTPVPVTPTNIVGTGIMYFSDGSQVAVTLTIDWVTKKIVAKDANGKEY